jgi:antagonist of KipI
MTLRLVAAGLQTLLVDFGRPRTRSLGVPVGGAADRWSLALGNALVGNPPDAAALELCLDGPTVTADCDVACVIFGAPFAVRYAGQKRTAGTTFTLRAGAELEIGGTAGRARAYLCVAGGLHAEPVLGSVSSLEPLAAGAEIGCAPGAAAGRFVRPDWAWDREPNVLRTLGGAQADWLDCTEFYSQEFRVSPLSNRVGLRLEGPALSRPDREIVSEPVCPGGVQVTRDGRCIILGVDGPTVGGYPKIAQVISADLDKLGQLRPGDTVRFRRVSLAEAEVTGRLKRDELRAWVTRLRATYPPPAAPARRTRSK